MYSTLSTQDLGIPTNIVLASTTLVVRIPSSPSMVYGEKSKKFNGLNLKRWKQKNIILYYHLKFGKILDCGSAKHIRK